jgi:hypothetical protein
VGIKVASIWSNPRSQYWTAYFRDATGRQRRISTRETNEFKARLIASTYEKASRKRRTEFRTRRVIAQLHEELGGEPIPMGNTPLQNERRQQRLALLEEELAQLSNRNYLPDRLWSTVREIGCTGCGFNKWSKILQVHHIDRNPRNNLLENLTILCPNCHWALHHGIVKIEFKSLAQLLLEQDCARNPEPLWEPSAWVARRYGLPRYRVFELIKEGQIRSALIKRKGRKKGLRLIELSSVTRYLEEHVSKPEESNG